MSTFKASCSKSQVYVDVPNSPYPQSRTHPIQAPAHVSAVPNLGLKENTPIRRPTAASMAIDSPSTQSSARKRKLSSNSVMAYVEIDSPSYIKAKKAKLERLSGSGSFPQSKQPLKQSSTLQSGNQVVAKAAQSKGSPKKDASAKSKATKGKLSATSSRANATLDHKVSDEFPNGFFYCHQCSKKRDAAVGIQCTMKDTKHKRCRTHWCKGCLKNRYGQNIDDIKAQGKNIPGDKQDQYDADEAYTFKCPKCAGHCNCSGCRKAKGLEPTGNLTLAARQAGKSVASFLEDNPNTVGIMPGKGAQVVHEKKAKPAEPKPPQMKRSGQPVLDDKSAASKADLPPKSRAPRAKPKKLVSLPKWSKIYLPLTLESAEDRFQVREFVLRFAPAMDIARGHLEELERIGGTSKGRSLDEDEELVPWVSEACVKSILLGLLALFTKEDDSLKKVVKDAIKDIRSSASNISRMWCTLSNLRDTIESQTSSADSSASAVTLDFADPLPPPSSGMMRTTRATRASEAAGVLVTHTAQMVPVIVSLIDASLQTLAVRNELEKGTSDGKETLKEGREASKQEKERWEALQASVKGRTDAKEDETKASRNEHKQRHLDNEMALKVAMSSYVPRVGPLGRDTNGRVYWILSPGPAEREAALDFVASSAAEGVGRVGMQNAKAVRKCVPSPDELGAMRDWSWFLAVWGKRPAAGQIKTAQKAGKEAASDDEDEASDDDEDENKWWGFYDPSEIRKVGQWISAQNGLEATDAEDGPSSKPPAPGPAANAADAPPLTGMSEHDVRDVDMTIGTPTTAELKALVKSLDEYADLLQWRINREQIIANEASGAKGKGRAA